ncbi:MAG: TAXI family TRAP transporter solute-binding subunit [Pseudolabrys sp.]|nr:TAXI family TRAP transporter solute-binding subunit [Pseudolabrys sp.]
MNKITITALSALLLPAITCATAGFAQEKADISSIKLPRLLSWSVFPSVSPTYAQGIAIGAALDKRLDVKLRLLPGSNDVARNAPLRSGTVQFMMAGTGAYFAQEGLQEFSAKSWGPQKLRVAAESLGASGLGLITAKDAGIHLPADLKGKRVPFIHGQPSLNQCTTAWLAFGNLTWKDVERVEVSGIGAAAKAIIDGKTDVLCTSTASPIARELEGSSRGIIIPPLPFADKAGWKRFLDAAPYYSQHIVTAGPGLSKQHPLEGATTPFPILVSYAKEDDSVVYNMVKAMHLLFDDYKAAEATAAGWEIHRWPLRWKIPFHAGSIAYLKEQKLWSDDLQKYNDRLVQRQNILGDTWQKVKGQSHADDAAFEQAWLKARETALKAAGFETGTQ